ncbi:MAG: hypothetical protein DRJ41_05155 [Thermoprotei archaeon]|nr:MAG: hypothetical protein DRJ41_05155 [Thermoprotei archaeon]
MYDLEVPPEPLDLKREAIAKARSKEWSFIGRESTIKFFTLGSQGLPKYLWNYWKPALKAMKVSWQLFLRVISACEYDVIAWVEGKRSWEELVSIVLKVLRRACEGKYPLWPPSD